MKAPNLKAVPALQDICTDKECEEKSLLACPKMLPCNHSCFGYRGETKCLLCLHEDCSGKIKELLDQKGSTFCNVC